MKRAAVYCPRVEMATVYCSMVEIEMKRAAVYCSRVGMATVKVHTRHTAGSEGTHDWKRRPIFALCAAAAATGCQRGQSAENSNQCGCFFF